MSGKPIILSLMGGPGCGKGTVSAQICQHYNCGYMSAGDLLRAAAKTDKALGEMLTNGVIVPQEITIGLLKAEIERQAKDFYIIDGFPRKVDQADTFEATVNPFAAMIFIDVSDEVLLSRLLNRAQTSEVKRSDDTPEGFQKRLKVFHDVSYPVLEHFQKKNKAFVIKGEGSKEEVYAAVSKVIDSILHKN